LQPSSKEWTASALVAEKCRNGTREKMNIFFHNFFGRGEVGLVWVFCFAVAVIVVVVAVAEERTASASVEKYRK